MGPRKPKMGKRRKSFDGSVAQLVRASSLYLEGRWFESIRTHQPSLGFAELRLAGQPTLGRPALAKAVPPKLRNGAKGDAYPVLKFPFHSVPLPAELWWGFVKKRTMPFILLGILMIIMGGYFSYLGKKQEKREMALGALGLIFAGVLLSVVFIIVMAIESL